ncbi:hypothetical protein CTI12_AA375470 [Artemisia annua]|uniref:Uncharacterized protein n=1 Tax=Artemisia annua TaxID=35608 RepID=A0A2U1MIP9_ARTAN|nr:hypothetical protein CTI12_AA375470 [Artemisia annua]
MAYRRRQGLSRSSTFKEEPHCPPHDVVVSTSSSVASAPSSPLGSQANRAPITHRESPLSLAGYANSPFHSLVRDRSKVLHYAPYNQMIALRIYYFGLFSACCAIGFGEGNEGGSDVDKRPQNTQETSKVDKRKTETNHEDFWMQNQLQENRTQSSQPQTIHEHQLKASRDVAIATAAKAKLLLREIKTVKADLAFAKQRSSQLEEENKILREAREKGDHPADDDMIRLQLETLLAEKARLANENSVYVRENSCLREIIKYHKLSMQDIVYVDEGIEEVAEVNPKISRTLSVSPPLPSSPQTKTPLRKKESPPIPKSLDVPTKKNPPIKSSTNHAST